MKMAFEELKITVEELKKKYWKGWCVDCGWYGWSLNMDGGYFNGEDYDDCICPRCGGDVEEGRHGKRWFLWGWRWITMWAKRKRAAEEKAIETFKGEE